MLRCQSGRYSSAEEPTDWLALLWIEGNRHIL